MPTLPNAQETKAVYHVLSGHIYFQALSAAVQFDLFSKLQEKGPLDRKKITAMLNINEQACRILLLPLVATEILKKDGENYSNTNLSEYYFCKSSPNCINNLVLWQHFINYKAMFYFYESLIENKNVGLQEFKGTEPTLYQRLAHEPKLELIFQKAMQDISVQAQKDFSENIDLSQTKFLVDVGGGNGSNIITLAKKFPHLRAAVFDSPSVCKIAQENIAKNGLSDRLSVIHGNCLTDEFPKEADCLLFCHFFTIWSIEQDEMLLKKAFRSLPIGGRAMIFNMMQNNSEDGPLSAAMGSPYFLTLATGTGMLYTWNEYKEMFKSAGFTKIESQQLPVDHGAIWGYKPSI